MPQITKTFLKTLEPTGKTQVHWDTQTRGFGVRCYPSGELAFIARYRLKGSRRQKFVVIGKPADTALDAARARAAEYIAAARDGRDLADEAVERTQTAEAAKAALAARVTVAEAASRYLAEFAAGEAHGVRKRAENSVRAEGAWVGHLTAEHGASALADVTGEDIRLVVQACNVGSRRSVFGAISRFCAWAVACKIIEASPCVSVARPRKPNSREVTPSPAEVRKFVADIESLASQGRMTRTGADFLTLCALLAQRRSEVGSMKWEHLDLKAKLWNQPSESNKARRSHAVPLAPRALAIIERRRAEVIREGREVVGYVLPGRFSPCIKGNANNLMKQLRAVTVVPFRLHDLRRGAVSAMAELGVDATVADLLLNHAASETRSGIAAIYNRSELAAPRRRAMELWEAAVFGEVGQVVAFKKASA